MGPFATLRPSSKISRRPRLRRELANSASSAHRRKYYRRASLMMLSLALERTGEALRSAGGCIERSRQPSQGGRSQHTGPDSEEAVGKHSGKRYPSVITGRAPPLEMPDDEHYLNVIKTGSATNNTQTYPSPSYFGYQNLGVLENMCESGGQSAARWKRCGGRGPSLIL